MGDYPGRKQVRNRAKRAVKNDRIIRMRPRRKEQPRLKFRSVCGLNLNILVRRASVAIDQSRRIEPITPHRPRMHSVLRQHGTEYHGQSHQNQDEYGDLDDETSSIHSNRV